MRNFMFCLMLIVVAVFALACAMPPAANDASEPCIGTSEEQATCWKQRYEILQGDIVKGRSPQTRKDEAPAAAHEPAAPPSLQPADQPVRDQRFGEFQTILRPGLNGACRYGYDIIVPNDDNSGNPLVEVQGDNLALCGGSGVIGYRVKTAIGGKPRNAYLVPMGSTARFTYLGSGSFRLTMMSYDAPWIDQDLGVWVATANGRKRSDYFSGSSDGPTGTWTYAIRRGYLH